MIEKCTECGATAPWGHTKCVWCTNHIVSGEINEYLHQQNEYALKITLAENGFYLLGIGESDYSQVITNDKHAKKKMFEEIEQFFNFK